MNSLMTFGSTHKVLKAESVLKPLDIKFRLNPAPKFIKRVKPRCSLIITIDSQLLENVVSILTEKGVPPVSVYKSTGGKVIFDGVEEDEYEEYNEV